MAKNRKLYPVLPLTTDGDLITQINGAPARLPKGADNTALETVTGMLTWVATPSPYIVTTITSDPNPSVSGTTYITDTSSAPFNLTLPLPVSGAFIIIKDKKGTFQSNPITLLRHASEKIEGLAASKVLQTSWGSWSIFSDGTDWYIGPF